jgi:hypothetical protein
MKNSVLVEQTLENLCIFSKGYHASAHSQTSVQYDFVFYTEDFKTVSVFDQMRKLLSFWPISQKGYIWPKTPKKLYLKAR